MFLEKVLTVFVLASSLVLADDDAAKPVESCRHVVVRLVKRQLGEMSICINTMQEAGMFKNKKDRAAKLACIVKCVGIREKMLAEDGSLSQELAIAYMEKEIPKKWLPYAQPILQKCFDLGIDVVDPKEEYCKSYKPVIKCVMDETTKLCDAHELFVDV